MSKRTTLHQKIIDFGINKISDKLEIIDDIVFERCSIPLTPIFDYLPEAIGRAQRMTEPSSENLRKVLQEIKLILRNYFMLIVTTPELFDQADLSLKWQLITTEGSKRPEVHSSVKLLYLAFNAPDDKLIDEVLENVDKSSTVVKTSLRLFQLRLSKLTIFEPESIDLLNLFAKLLKSNNFHKLITDNEVLKKIDSGSQLENESVLGTLLSLGPLPWSSADPRIANFQSLVINRIEASKTAGAYIKNKQVILLDNF